MLYNVTVPNRTSLTALICVHDDDVFLPVVLGSLPAWVTPYVFVSQVPWHGSAGHWEQTARLASELGATTVIGSWATEESHRREAVEHLKAQGFKHALILDTDEVPEPRLLETLRSLAENDLADRVRCSMDTYWQDAMHVIRPRERLAPIVLIKLDAVTHLRIRDFEGGREIVLGPEYGVLHHLSYAGSDERICRKIETWSHRDELVPDWWRRSWLGWKHDPTMKALHPTHPEAYGWVERIPCPEILASAFGASVSLPAVRPKKWPTVSVIIPLHGGEEDIRGCLQSLRAFQDLLHEVIVVDDVSPDAAASAVQDFDFATLIRNEQNLGFGGTCNRGLEASTGDVVVFLNSDTLVPRSGLIELVSVLLGSGSIGASGPVTNNAGYYQWVDPTYTSLDTIELFAQDLATSKREDRDVDMLVGFCLAVRRSVLDEVGAFDERFGPRAL